jgi:hypothetical protein
MGHCLAHLLPLVSTVTVFMGYCRLQNLEAFFAAPWVNVTALLLDLRRCELTDRDLSVLTRCALVHVVCTSGPGCANNLCGSASCCCTSQATL